MEINHFSHEEHPLILKDLQIDELEEVVCYGCKQPIITESSTTYCCLECKFFLHKSCAEAPLEIEYPMHQDHPLQLLSKPRYKSGSCNCNVCGREGWNGFTYNCSKCEFDVDILCAQMESNSIIKHPGHHHPLKFQPKSAMFQCDACRTKEEDQSYDCTVCSFRIHKSCGSIPPTSSFKAHLHPLSLAYYFPEKYRKYQENCDICKKKLHQNYWVFYCRPCRYIVHLKCITSKEDAATETNSKILGWSYGESSNATSYGESSNATIDLRFSELKCPCGRKCDVRIVGNIQSRNKGRLFYKCEPCNFFRRCHPFSMTWSATRELILPPSHFPNDVHHDVCHDYEEVTSPNLNNTNTRDEYLRKLYHVALVIAAMFVALVLVIASKS